MGWRRSFWWTFMGVPRGLLGRIGARMQARILRRNYALIADALRLERDDELLDVGCGSGMLLATHARHVRHVAGLDVSDIQLKMARARLADRIAGGTAEVVKGDAAHLPWPDDSFSAVTSTYCFKFLADPEQAMREMHRVLRPGGRAVLTMCDWEPNAASGSLDAWGQRFWSEADARAMMERAGFTGVNTSAMGTPKFELVRGSKLAAAQAKAAQVRQVVGVGA